MPIQGAWSRRVNGNDLAPTVGTDADQVKRLAVDNLRMIEISYPRPQPQGWMGERDMHCGQQFARLLDIEIG